MSKHVREVLWSCKLLATIAAVVMLAGPVAHAQPAGSTKPGGVENLPGGQSDARTGATAPKISTDASAAGRTSTFGTVGSSRPKSFSKAARKPAASKPSATKSPAAKSQ